MSGRIVLKGTAQTVAWTTLREFIDGTKATLSYTFEEQNGVAGHYRVVTEPFGGIYREAFISRSSSDQAADLLDFESNFRDSPNVIPYTAVQLLNSSGSLVTPTLTPEGRFPVDIAAPPSVVVGELPPEQVDGVKIWHNTTPGSEGLYFFDQNREKWLSVDSQSLFWGEDSADGNVMEPVGVRTMPASGGYRLPRAGTIVGITTFSNSGNAAKSFEVRINNVEPAALAYTTADNVFVSNTLNINFSAGDMINSGALPGGPAATDVTSILYYRWRS